MLKASIASLTARTPSTLSRRGFHASPAAHKTVTEKVTEVADKVNKTVGKGLASAIDKGEKATYAAKDTLSSTTEDVKGKAAEAEGSVKQAGKDAAAGAKKAKIDVEKKL